MYFELFNKLNLIFKNYRALVSLPRLKPGSGCWPVLRPLLLDPSLRPFLSSRSSGLPLTATLAPGSFCPIPPQQTPSPASRSRCCSHWSSRPGVPSPRAADRYVGPWPARNPAAQPEVSVREGALLPGRNPTVNLSEGSRLPALYENLTIMI